MVVKIYETTIFVKNAASWSDILFSAFFMPMRRGYASCWQPPVRGVPPVPRRTGSGKEGPGPDLSDIYGGNYAEIVRLLFRVRFLPPLLDLVPRGASACGAHAGARGTGFSQRHSSVCHQGGDMVAFCASKRLVLLLDFEGAPGAPFSSPLSHPAQPSSSSSPTCSRTWDTV